MTQSEIIESFLTKVRSCLAPEAIHPLYYGLHYWESTNHYLDNLTETKELLLRPYLERYHERVFCYELYHKLRFLMDSENDNKRQNLYSAQNIFLQSELIKSQVNQFIEMIYEITKLSKEFMPDFLLHTPGNFSNQLIVMEVKSTPTLSNNEIKADLLKIQEFINNYQYQKGIFIAVNVPIEVRKQRLLHLSKWYTNNINTPEKISLFFKENPSSEMQEYSFTDLSKGFS